MIRGDLYNGESPLLNLPNFSLQLWLRLSYSWRKQKQEVTHPATSHTVQQYSRQHPIVINIAFSLSDNAALSDHGLSYGHPWPLEQHIPLIA